MFGIAFEGRTMAPPQELPELPAEGALTEVDGICGSLALLYRSESSASEAWELQIAVSGEFNIPVLPHVVFYRVVEGEVEEAEAVTAATLGATWKTHKATSEAPRQLVISFPNHTPKPLKKGELLGIGITG